MSKGKGKHQAPRRLAEFAIGELDLRHLDGEGGAWWALEMVAVFEAAQQAGWKLKAPLQGPEVPTGLLP